jgi:hypothetical protein
MFNEEGGIDVEEFRFKAIVDRVQTTSTALLGLTMHCAQCHNHKYDDISQKEYYRFFALLNNADEPQMDMPDPAIAEARRQQQEKIDQLTRELPGKFPARDESIKWQVIEPQVFATTRPSSYLTLLKDGSLLAKGKNPKNGDRYIIESDVDITGVSAFRLEVMNDPSLPRTGPGRSPNGNLVLSQFKVEQAEPGEEESPATRVKIDRAEADYSQPEFEIVKAIDDTIQKGWSIGGPGVSFHRAHAATFYTPDKLSGTRKLIITLRQEFKDNNIGRFRLSIGRTPPPPTTQPTPGRPGKIPRAEHRRVGRVDQAEVRALDDPSTPRASRAGTTRRSPSWTTSRCCSPATIFIARNTSSTSTRSRRTSRRCGSSFCRTPRCRVAGRGVIRAAGVCSAS